MPKSPIITMLSLTCATLICGISPTQAQNFQHFEPPPAPAPAAPPAPAPVPVPIPAPVIPTAPPDIPLAPPPSTPDTAAINTASTGSNVNSLEGLKAKKEEIRGKLNILNKGVEETLKAYDAFTALLRSGELGSFAFYGEGSLEEAESHLSKAQKYLVSSEKSLENIDAKLASIDPEGDPSTYQYWLKARAKVVTYIQNTKNDISYWEGEVGRLTPLMQKYRSLEKAYSEASEKRNEIQEKLGEAAKQYNDAKSKLKDKEIKDNITAVEEKIETADKKQESIQKLLDQKTEENEKWPSEDESKLISLTELSPDESDYIEQVKSDTADLDANMTYQEFMVEEQEAAFSELSMANAKLTVLEGADFAGNMAQFGIGMVPGWGGVDASLSGMRGFAESLGQSIADGVAPADAVKAALLNAGYTATITVVGNKLTGPADKLAERVIVLGEVGFSKLKTKQIAELGAKGITVMVVKSSQLIGSVAADAKGRKIAKDLQKSMKSSSGSSRTSVSPNYGGYSTSVATQPLVQY